MNGSSLKVAKISPDSPLARDGISLDDLGAVGVLTRQGHTEENDVLIDFLRNDLMKWQTLEQAFAKLQELVEEFIRNPNKNRLKQQIPQMRIVHSPLHLVEAFKWYDSVYKLSTRLHVKPSFADLRHILNIAQMSAVVPGLRMVTMDGDGTIYRHNQCIENPELVEAILDVLRKGMVFGLVTAAGYPGKADRYEQRLGLVLEALYDHVSRGTMPADTLERFFVIGGECNYLLRAATREDGKSLGLSFVPNEEWKTPELLEWTDSQIKNVLDRGTAALEEVTQRLNMAVQIYRKERAVGIIPTNEVTTEDLDEVVLSLHHELHDAEVPFTAFNSRVDVWLDIGSKGHGIRCMSDHYGIKPHEILHIGDELYSTGNDRTARESSCTVW
eukprot:CAMPEP_0114298186 /NCGR_PEP_ID=MMETSP0059-20121206/12284_1 /TAXON_ID=36894 /ORGANISM="Pyramimonas parkeae, Strain CCMP726" /LENGTH=385 /DNA_ID=CAMNT_0001420531 /DNA_START=88 /DNA_END=1242 /DNA_ORIENTATION=+